MKASAARSVNITMALAIASVVACLLISQASAARVDSDLKVKLTHTAAATSGGDKPTGSGVCHAWRKCRADFDNVGLCLFKGSKDASYGFGDENCVSTLQAIVGAEVTGKFDDGTSLAILRFGLPFDAMHAICVDEWDVLGRESGCAKAAEDTDLKVKAAQQDTAAEASGGNKPTAALKAGKAPAVCHAWKKCRADFDNVASLCLYRGTKDTSYGFDDEKCVSTLQTMVGAEVTGKFDDGTSLAILKYGLSFDAMSVICADEWDVIGRKSGCIKV